MWMCHTPSHMNESREIWMRHARYAYVRHAISEYVFHAKSERVTPRYLWIVTSRMHAACHIWMCYSPWMGQVTYEYIMLHKNESRHTSGRRHGILTSTRSTRGDRDSKLHDIWSKSCHMWHDSIICDMWQDSITCDVTLSHGHHFIVASHMIESCHRRIRQFAVSSQASAQGTRGDRDSDSHHM